MAAGSTCKPRLPAGAMTAPEPVALTKRRAPQVPSGSRGLGADQTSSSEGIGEHLQERPGGILQQRDPVAQKGGVIGHDTADLQPIAEQHRPQLDHELRAPRGHKPGPHRHQRLSRQGPIGLTPPLDQPLQDLRFQISGIEHRFRPIGNPAAALFRALQTITRASALRRGGWVGSLRWWAWGRSTCTTLLPLRGTIPSALASAKPHQQGRANPRAGAGPA